MSKAIILDSETTGLPPTGEACEIAFFPINSIVFTCFKGVQAEGYLQRSLDLITDIKYSDYYHQTFMPIGDFHPRASAVNGFTKENLKSSPCISTFKFPENVTYLIGHNVLFDYEILKRPEGVELICTKELAIKYLTKVSGAGTKGMNTLTGLIERYYPEEAATLISNAHSALQDCKLCYLILLKVLEAVPELDSFEKLAGQCTQPNWSKTSNKLPFGVTQDSCTKEYICNFGAKHKGKSYADILKQDRGYLVWVVGKSTMPYDLKEFIKNLL